MHRRGGASPWRGPRRAVRVGTWQFVGELDPIMPLLAEAEVVVTSAGWAAVADTVAAGTRVVVIPEERPFDEQRIRAEALHEAGLAVSCSHWPSPAQLAAVVDEALQLEPSRWRAFHDGGGASRAARMIEEVHAA